MKKFKLFCLFILFSTLAISQGAETILQTDFAVRDFIFQKDSLFYISKRDVSLLDLKTKSNKRYFIGGYGLKFLTDNNPNTIISVSNELVNNVSSVRFYDKQKRNINNVYYNKEGKILDAIIIPELNIFILSLISKKIIIVDYSEKPKFLKTAEINLNTFSRKLIHKNGALLFCTDKGEIFKYHINDYQKELLYENSELITDFCIEDQTLFFSTISGKLKKVNMTTNKVEEILIDNNFINTFVKTNKHLVCGSWNGEIIIINKLDLKVEKTLNYHKRSILKIKTVNDSVFYSSSLDQSIKKWKLN